MRAFENGIGCVDAERATALLVDQHRRQRVDRGRRRLRRLRRRLRPHHRAPARERRVGLVERQVPETGTSRARSRSARPSSSANLEGWVHFLDRATGEPLLRLPTDGHAIVGTPMVAATTIAVTTESGGVYAFRPE
jgi:hypothetical protein